MRASIDVGNSLPLPDGILINGLEPSQAIFYFEPGDNPFGAQIVFIY